MALPTSLNVALKEWASVCRALELGQQIVLLRKGGIYESGGEFEVEHREFLLFPTYLHQNPRMIKPEFHGDFEAMDAEPTTIRLSSAAEVTDIVELQSRKQMDAVGEQHIWTEPLIDMRFNYRPENPLYLLIVRAYRLREAVTIRNTPAYAGCKSWVPLEEAIATEEAVPVLDERQFEARRTLIVERLEKSTEGG